LAEAFPYVVTDAQGGPARPADKMIMKTSYVRVLLLEVVLALFPGCKSAEVYGTRAARMLDAEPPRLRSILLSDQPAIVVHLPKGCGWGEQVGTVWIEEAITGHSVWSASEFMRSGSTHTFLPSGLKQGTYVVILRADGEPVAVTNFDVR